MACDMRPSEYFADTPASAWSHASRDGSAMAMTGDTRRAAASGEPARLYDISVADRNGIGS